MVTNVGSGLLLLLSKVRGLVSPKFLGPFTDAHTGFTYIATKFGMVTHVGEQRVSRGQILPLLRGSGQASPDFWDL